MAEQLRDTAEPSPRTSNGAGRAAELAQLRRLLVGPEQRRLAELAERLDALELTPDALAEHLPDAIALRGSRDAQLGRALAPTVETALRESIRRNPREIATAIFPVLGPAIRKAIAETMAGLVRSINRAVEHSLSLRGIKWRLEAWRTGVPYAEIVIKHALVYRVEQVFLIHAESGLLLAHVSAPELAVPDADLISGMLTAIQDFVRDSFRPAEGATLRSFCVGEHTVHVEAGPQALLAAVIRGQAPDDVLLRIQDTLETIHLQFASQLADFSGDASPLQATRPLLSHCLETKLSFEHSRTPPRRAILRWALPLLLVVGLLGAWWIRAELRFRRAIALLRAEPGIVVVDASRGWWRLHAAGLRDPLARDPATVLAAAGLSRPVLSGEWRPYLALDSGMIVARARLLLGAPPALESALRGDTLALRGTAPLDWIARARQATLPPGLARLDVGAVEPVWPEALDALRRSIGESRILFAPGAFDLSESATLLLRDVAARFSRLIEAAAAAGGVIRLAIVGRTDPSGTSETNESLARQRVDAVAGRLASLGIDSALFSREPLATSQPLPAADAEIRARVNRSVSFVVSLSIGPITPGGR
ncbi:MAG TPA: hypothetical protein VLE53_07500 [Gemmatimonadaceae bacterium]|nr:hypothetical protein [Gemmatimonadaceae bacterium]